MYETCYNYRTQRYKSYEKFKLLFILKKILRTNLDRFYDRLTREPRPKWLKL